LFGNPLSGVTKRCAYVPSSGSGAGALRAEYWANTTFTGLPALVREQLPALDLGDGQAPGTDLPTSGFAVRFSGAFTAASSGAHVLRLNTSAGDGARLWVNEQLVLDSWQAPRTQQDATVQLVAGQAVSLRLEFFDAAAEARLGLSWQQPGAGGFAPIPADVFGPKPPPPAGALKAEYWPNLQFTGVPLLTRNELPALRLGDGEGPGSGLPTSRFAVRWTGTLTPAQAGTYALRSQASAADGVRVWVDDVLLIDAWERPAASAQGSIELAAGRPVSVRVEFFDAAAEAVFSLAWRAPGSADFLPIPSAVFNPQALPPAGALRAEFWDNTGFTGQPVISRDALPVLNLPDGVGPGAGLPTSRFAVRFSGRFTPASSGETALRTLASAGDGVRLWVDGRLLIDTWASPQRVADAAITLTAGQPVALVLEFFDAAAEAELQLLWRAPGAEGWTELPAPLLKPTPP
jgi:hypothetical protein